jgi:uncharacterized damage-inducible protein DinB
MLAIATGLGDDLVNVRPALEGANSAYVVLFHCVGMTDWWVGRHIAGRDVTRDRDAEFTATGTVADLAAAIPAVRERYRADLAGADLDAPIVDAGRYPEDSAARRWSKGAALLHVVEELAQHHGQMELTRDLLTRRTGE